MTPGSLPSYLPPSFISPSFRGGLRGGLFPSGDFFPSFPWKRESIRESIRLFVSVRHPPCHVKMDSRFRGNDRRRGMTKGGRATFFATSGFFSSFPCKRESIRASIRLFVSVRHPPCHVKMDSRVRGNDRRSAGMTISHPVFGGWDDKPPWPPLSGGTLTCRGAEGSRGHADIAAARQAPRLKSCLPFAAQFPKLSSWCTQQTWFPAPGVVARRSPCNPEISG